MTRTEAKVPCGEQGTGNPYLLIAVLFAIYFLSYLDRAVMATAIPFISRELALSSFDAGAVMSAFFLGYAAMQIPAGVLSDKFGPTHVLVVAIFAWSVFTALTGLVSSLFAMIVVRVLFGICEGPAPAAISKAVAISYSRERIGRANGAVIAGTLVGAALAPTFVTTMVLQWGWRSSFFSLLIPGLLLALATHRVLGRSSERSHAVAHHAASASPTRSRQALDWGSVWSSSALRWCLVTVLFANTANWGLMNWLPTYLLEARGFGISKMGLYASLPFAAGALGYVASGFLADRFFAERRHVLVICCLIISAVGTYGAATAATGEMAVLFLTVTFFVLSMAMSALFTFPLLLVSPDVTGTAFGVVNTGAQIAGFLSPLLIGAILQLSDKDFSAAFYAIAALLLLACVTATRIKSRTP